MMVKFDRAAVINLFQSLHPPVNIELRVVGNLTNGFPFAGTDIIKVISGGRGPQNTSPIPIDIPKAFSLSPAFPNPFHKETIIKYGLPKACNVTLKIYDAAGRVVRRLLNAYENPGFKTLVWNGEDDIGNNLGSGVYFVQLQTDGFVKTERVILIK